MKNITALLIACLMISFRVFAQEINPNRPQEPQKPYPYHSEDIAFKNKQANITLAGTLTLPQKDGFFPAVILISGSGPQNRDEELAGHKPFLVLSDYLSRNGFAVLRFDDRGTALSEGNHDNATSEDLATDVQSGIDYLKTRDEINPDKIGLIGHSEGGLIAPLVAAQSKDVAFIIMLGGPGIPGDKILLIQQQLIAKVEGLGNKEISLTKKMNKKIFSSVKNNTDAATLKSDLKSELELFFK